MPAHNPLTTALISVDVVALRLHKGALQVLTAPATHQNARHSRALPSGRIQPDSDHELEQTARRHIASLTKAEPAWLEQVETIGNDHRDSRGWSLTVVYFALLRDEENSDRKDALWLDTGSCLPELAYDHNALLEAAITRLRSKLQYTTLPLYLLPETFTLADVQQVFDCILGKAPPMRSLRNRFACDNILEDTGEKRYGSNRPATLYRIAPTESQRLFNRLYHSILQ